MIVSSLFKHWLFSELIADADRRVQHSSKPVDIAGCKAENFIPPDFEI